MNRVISFILLSLLMLSVTTFFIADVDEEEDISYFVSNEVVTNTTIFKELDPQVKVKKVLRDFNLDNFYETTERNIDFSITKLNFDLEQLNKELTFLIKRQNFNKFKTDNGGIKGIYVNGYHMDNKNKIDAILDITDKTNINTLVIDVKTDNGHILFESDNELSKQMNNIRSKYDEFIIREYKNKNLYLIGRVVVFQDPTFAKTFPNEAVFDTAKKTIYSQDGQYFIDPGSKLAQKYILDISKEACLLGFDEIQFDYIRYPDSNYKFMKFKDENNYENRVNNINTFLKNGKEELNAIGCFVSADIFGYVLSNKFDGGIGQNLETLSENVDFISPMVYPSHYSNGSFGYDNPNKNPYGVVTSALNDGLERDIEPKKLRPYLQGFWHSSEDVKENIRAAEDKGLDWLIWNVSSFYNQEYFISIDS